MIELIFSYQTLYAGVDKPRKLGKDNTLYRLVYVDNSCPLGVWAFWNGTAFIK